MDVVLLEKAPVAAAGIHQRGREFAAEFGFGLGDDARQPFDALHRVGLGGHPGFVEDGGGRFSVLDVQEIVAADELDGEGAVVAGFAVVMVVLGVVIEILHGEAVGREEGRLVGGEVGACAGLAGGVEFDGLVVERAESVGEVVVFHGWCWPKEEQ